MRKRRWIAVACLGLLLGALLSGCTSSGMPLPEGMEEETLTAAGEEILQLLLDGQYTQVAEQFREDVRTEKEITAESVQDIMEQYANPDTVGQFQKIKRTEVSGETEGEEHGYVAFECKFSKKRVAIAVAFDPQMNLIGLSVAHE